MTNIACLSQVWGKSRKSKKKKKKHKHIHTFVLGDTFCHNQKHKVQLIFAQSHVYHKY